MAAPAMFEEAVIISGGTFNQFNSPSNSQEVLVALSSRINPELFHNSKKHDILRKSSTTFSVAESEVDDILAWRIGSDVSDGDFQSDLLPLRRCVSKEYAQHLSLFLSEQLERSGALLASIMLPPHGPVDEYQIIPILVYQMARNIPSFSQHVQDALKNHPLLFDLNMESQIDKLIIEPLVKLEMATEDLSDGQRTGQTPNIVIITGSHAQVIEDPTCARVFNTISTLSKQRGLDAPISLIVISFPSKWLTYISPITVGASKLSANLIPIIIALSFT